MWYIHIQILGILLLFAKEIRVQKQNKVDNTVSKNIKKKEIIN